MRPVRQFEEFIREGIVVRKTADPSRSKNLLKEANKAHEFLHRILNSIDVSDSSANSIIKLAYDVIMETVRARMIATGLDASGRGAHEAEVAYLRELGFSEADVQFANQLRYFRNGIMYYGKSFDAAYARKVISFLDRFIDF